MTTAIVPTIETSNNELVVTSLTIAEGAGVQHKNTLELIEANRTELEEFGPLAFETRKGAALPQGGFAKATRIALLNEPQAMLLMTFQRNTAQVKAFKVALIKAFQTMAKQLQTPAPTGQNLLALAVLEADKMIKSLEAKIESDAGKVAYVDNHVDPANVTLFRTVCRNLQINESDLRQALIYRRWIYISNTSKMGDYIIREYAAHHNFQKYFKSCKYHHKKNGKALSRETLKITPEGVAGITRFVEKLTNEHGSLRAALPILEAKYNESKGVAA